jgi:four helix bundle protein
MVGVLHCLAAEGPMIQSYRDLIVWQKSMELAQRVYLSSRQFPADERFGLTSQVRRAAVSIPSNIAEGKSVGRLGYPRHLRIALGSEAELQTQIELARRLKLLTDLEAEELLQQIAEVGRLLTALLKALPKD